MLNNICIDRCLCFQKTFRELRVIAKLHEIEALEALQKKVEFGKNCQLCHPYVRRMLKSGETVFNEVLRE